jgi:hypothetical protein
MSQLQYIGFRKKLPTDKYEQVIDRDGYSCEEDVVEGTRVYRASHGLSVSFNIGEKVYITALPTEDGSMEEGAQQYPSNAIVFADPISIEDAVALLVQNKEAPQFKESISALFTYLVLNADAPCAGFRTLSPLTEIYVPSKIEDARPFLSHDWALQNEGRIAPEIWRAAIFGGEKYNQCAYEVCKLSPPKDILLYLNSRLDLESLDIDNPAPEFLGALFFAQGDREFDGKWLLKAYKAWGDKSPVQLKEALTNQLAQIPYKTLWKEYKTKRCLDFVGEYVEENIDRAPIDVAWRMWKERMIEKGGAPDPLTARVAENIDEIGAEKYPDLWAIRKQYGDQAPDFVLEVLKDWGEYLSQATSSEKSKALSLSKEIVKTDPNLRTPVSLAVARQFGRCDFIEDIWGDAHTDEWRKGHDMGKASTADISFAWQRSDKARLQLLKDVARTGDTEQVYEVWHNATREQRKAAWKLKSVRNNTNMFSGSPTDLAYLLKCDGAEEIREKFVEYTRRNWDKDNRKRVGNLLVEFSTNDERDREVREFLRDRIRPRPGDDFILQAIRNWEPSVVLSCFTPEEIKHAVTMNIRSEHWGLYLMYCLGDYPFDIFKEVIDVILDRLARNRAYSKVRAWFFEDSLDSYKGEKQKYFKEGFIRVASQGIRRGDKKEYLIGLFKIFREMPKNEWDDRLLAAAMENFSTKHFKEVYAARSQNVCMHFISHHPEHIDVSPIIRKLDISSLRSVIYKESDTHTVVSAARVLAERSKRVSVDDLIDNIKLMWEEVPRDMWDSNMLREAIGNLDTDELHQVVEKLPISALPSDLVVNAMMEMDVKNLCWFIEVVGVRTWTPEHSLRYAKDLPLANLMSFLSRVPVNRIHPHLFFKVSQVPLAFKEVLTQWGDYKRRSFILFLIKNKKNAKILRGIIQAGNITPDEAWPPRLSKVIVNAGGQWGRATENWTSTKKQIT